MLRRPIRVDSSTSYTKKLDPMARLDYCESFEYSYAEGTYGPSAIGGVHRNTPFALRMRRKFCLEKTEPGRVPGRLDQG